jgi:hypothetical protein
MVGLGLSSTFSLAVAAAVTVELQEQVTVQAEQAEQ